MLDIYRRIEDWHGAARSRTTAAQAARCSSSPRRIPTRWPARWSRRTSRIGIPSYASHNGAMMEGDGGASIIDLSRPRRAGASPCSARTSHPIWTGRI